MNNEGTQAPPSGYKQFIADHKEEIRETWKKVTTLRDKKNYIIFLQNVEESVQEGQRKITFVEALAAEWNRLPLPVKAQYEAEAKGKFKDVKLTKNLDILDRKQKYRDDSPYAW